jgi:hypothetical protein
MRKTAVVSTGAFVAPTIISVDAAHAQALTQPTARATRPAGLAPERRR